MLKKNEDLNNNTSTDDQQFYQKKINLKQQKHLINYYNRWMILITCFLINIILLSSWIIWISVYRQQGNDMLTLYNILLKQNNWKLDFNFDKLIILILITILINFILIFLPLLFLNKKNFFSLIIAFFSIFYCIIIFFFSLITTISVVKSKNDNIANKLIVIIPIAIISVLTIILFCNILWLLIAIINHHRYNKKSKNSNNIASINLNINNDKTPSHLIIPEIKILINNNDNELETSNTAVIKTICNENNKLKTTPALIEQWTAAEINAVWNQATIIPGYDKNLYRKDYAGAIIFKNSFKNFPTLETEINIKSYNWTIATKIPISQGGTRTIENLVASHTINFLTKGENYPHWKTAVMFDNKTKTNTHKIQNWTN